MPSVLLGIPAGVTGTITNPPFPLPIPPGLAGFGHVLTAQMVVLAPAGIGLSGASGIII
jgi:hypothetical protein